MEEFVSEVRIGLAEELFIQRLDLRIVMRLTDNLTFVFRIEGVGSLLLVGVHDVVVFVGKEYFANVGLSAAVDTTAGAAHDLNEGIRRSAFADLVEKDLCPAHTAGDGNFDLLTRKLEFGFADVFKTTDFVEDDALSLLAGKNEVSGTKGRFHNAAGDAEDNAGTRVVVDDIVVEVFVGKSVEEDTGTANDSAEFSRGKNGVYVAIAVVFHFGTVLLVLLARAGHDGYDEHILGINAYFLRYSQKLLWTLGTDYYRRRDAEISRLVSEHL